MGHFCLLPGVIEEEVWRACFAVGGEQNAGQVPSLHIESVLKPNKNKFKDVFSVQEGESSSKIFLKLPRHKIAAILLKVYGAVVLVIALVA